MHTKSVVADELLVKMPCGILKYRNTVFHFLTETSLLPFSAVLLSQFSEFGGTTVSLVPN